MAYAFNPRGRARSPQPVSPASTISPAATVTRMSNLKLNLDDIKTHNEEAMKALCTSPTEASLPAGTKLQVSPSSPVKIIAASDYIREPWSAQIEDLNDMSPGGVIFIKPRTGSQVRPLVPGRNSFVRAVVQEAKTQKDVVEGENLFPGMDGLSAQGNSPSVSPLRSPITASPAGSSRANTPAIQLNETAVTSPQLMQYRHDFTTREHRSRNSHGTVNSSSSDENTTSSGSHSEAGQPEERLPRRPLSRPPSGAALGTDQMQRRGRSMTPHGLRGTPSPTRPWMRNLSASHSPDARPISYVDLLNIPYSQQVAQQTVILDNALLQGAVGINASLLDMSKTLEMYRANVKKTNDPAIQYEFAVFMVSAAQQAAAADSASNDQQVDGTSENGRGSPNTSLNPQEMLKESRQILQRLAETKSYPFAQYYLADGYASGVFSKGKADYDKAFPLFVSAGKHGHAEGGYRAALCFEFGWGCRRDYNKAVQFYRQSASKGHPGAATRLGKACLAGDMGLSGKYKEGIKWLKRANEAADRQHNSAPYELGIMHTTGFGDDVFKDEAYAAQLFTKAAELGHAQASYKMGEAYEHGMLTCPRDPGLSIHFYNGAAQAGLPQAMMALCAWYIVGAEPILEKDEPEAYEWAKKAAMAGYAKAEYAVGYFMEMGVGCARDILESNSWYERAAAQGDERAKQRLAIIRAAEAGEAMQTLSPPPQSQNRLSKKRSMLKVGEDKDCIVM